MAEWVRKPGVCEAEQWWEHGDVEGVTVNNRSRGPGEDWCRACPKPLDIHGVANGYVICPGNWIMTDAQGNLHRVSDEKLHDEWEVV